jgi:hypothetical protein
MKLTRIATMALLTVATMMLATVSLAQPQHRPAPHSLPRHWQGDIHRFHERDWHTWRSGRWSHGLHDGRLGWWWVAAGQWYFYPSPVYPYPNPYLPPPIELVTPQAGAPPPPTQYWYFCEAAKSYYPYVTTCPSGWKQAPAVLPDATKTPPK